MLEEALNIWELRFVETVFYSWCSTSYALYFSLVRWRSEAMKPYQDEPQYVIMNPHLLFLIILSSPSNQTAFVLNHNQHWYTLRRFGNLSNPGNGHWFNLDSTKRQPQWISKLYLGMFLQQAENDGYSVFSVMKIDPEAHSQLPHVDADDIASTLPDPTSASSVTRDDVEPGFENEDMELQAALQASLMATGDIGSSPAMPSVYPPAPTNLSASDMRGPSSSRLSGRAGHGMPDIPPNQDPYGNADVDPIVASMERDRIVMERIRREQELGFRQQYEEEVTRLRNQQPPHGAQDRGNEDEYLNRAITESLAGRQARGDLDDDDFEDADYVPPPEEARISNMGQQNRVYDDDDADFQAALRASLESAPAEISPLPMQRSLQTRQPPSHISTTSEEHEIDNQSEVDTSTVASDNGASDEVSMEEMRKRRLARFGG